MDFVKVAHIMNTQGIKGELKMEPLTENIARFSADIPYFIGEKKRPVTIDSFREYKNLIYMKFQEINHIDEAALYKNQYLYIYEEDRLPLEEGHYYIDQLIGLTVVDQEKGVVGQVTDLLGSGVHDIIQAKDKKGKDFYFPAIENYVQKVDLDQGQILVSLIEGILNED